MRIGIFFGGPSREREISFAGGRTVYDNLDKALFEPVPIFVDSLGHFVLLEWEYLYKGSIRDFYPPNDCTPASAFSVYIESLETLDEAQLDRLIDRVGRRIAPDQFSALFDVAFLALHGPYGEDGAIQGLLEWYQIPYTGTGVLGAALGINKVVQQRLMAQAGFAVPRSQTLSREAWQTTANKAALFDEVVAAIGLPIVVKSPSQGSSLGVTIVKEKSLTQFIAAVNNSLFIQEVTGATWQARSPEEKAQWMESLIDLREGIGLPVAVGEQVIAHPDKLLAYLDQHFATDGSPLQLASLRGEASVLFEAYVAGREFSCIVLEATPGQPVALPPTEMIKSEAIFDYRAKYLPGIVRKETPIQLPLDRVQAIRAACAALFQVLGFEVYARIDGFYGADQQIYLNDPNTTAGMNPSSFFFHQAAEVGLNPTQLLTFLIRTSLAARLRAYKTGTQMAQLLAQLDAHRLEGAQGQAAKLRVGVIMGGFSAERHISVESGRNIYEKLASSTEYTPVPLFLSGTPEAHRLFVIPVPVLLKDNADDIHERLLQPDAAAHQDLLGPIQQEVAHIVRQYVGEPTLQPKEVRYEQLKELVDFAFIALHGRPGEDGALQAVLEEQGIPYNGSGVQSSALTIDKFETNQLLRTHGIRVADQLVVAQAAWEQDSAAAICQIEAQFSYPLIAKPVDEGCSAAVMKIKNKAMLQAYAAATFRATTSLTADQARALGLQLNAEFPNNGRFLAEALVVQGEAAQFLEITGGLLTHLDAQGQRTYEVLMPSEVLAAGEVLSLEEKFLAGEGQNITPARFHPDLATSQQIAARVRQDLEKVAMLLDLEGYARIDAFVKVYSPEQVETWIIEVNSLPAMTPATCIFHQCALASYKPLAFIQSIIQYGLQTKK